MQEACDEIAPAVPHEGSLRGAINRHKRKREKIYTPFVNSWNSSAEDDLRAAIWRETKDQRRIFFESQKQHSDQQRQKYSVSPAEQV